MKEPVALIFDLDGTLVDSLRDITDALNHALAQVGRSAVDERQVRAWIGDGLPTLCRRAALHARCEDRLDELLALARAAYEVNCARHTTCFPNVLKMLDLLHARRVPMAVLSNKPHALTQRVIDALVLRKYFVAAQGYKCEEFKKPSPYCALKLAEAMGAMHDQVMIVGDSPVDIATARNAGMIAGAVAWGFQDLELLDAAAPDYFFSDPLKIFFAICGDSPPERGGTDGSRT